MKNEELKEESKAFNYFTTDKDIENYIYDPLVSDESIIICLRIGLENLAM